MRVEVLFDKQAKVSQPVMAAKVSPQFSNARFRVARRLRIVSAMT